MKAIDFRSDTVTWPTPAMREAMATAEVGDDVYGDDPTILALEAEAAAMLGKEAGLFVVSGTMGNLTCTMTHCGRGDEMIVGRDAHIIRYEVGSHAGLGSIHPYMLEVQPDGTLDLDDIRRAIRSENEHFPTTKLICLENTQAHTGGAVLSPDYMRQVAEIARAHDVRIHVDGARIFNAATALGVPARVLAEHADSLTFCLSKGLCAPFGSVVVGSQAFIARARKSRKRLGGGMRQGGIMAAAGLVALREMTTRLADDHATARQLADGLAAIPYVKLEPDRVKTNIVFFELTEDAPLDAVALSARLKADYNILMRPYDPRARRFRAVTHYYIKPDDVERALEALRAILGVPIAA